MRKGIRNNTIQYVPTSGVRTDLKRFMNKFLAANTVRYEHFSEVWRQKNMSFLYAGRWSDREMREFIERIIMIAKEFFLPPFQFQVRVGGLYLLYALYQTQPAVPKVTIRMTPAQWQDTLYFQQQAAQQNHLDVVYVFQRLLQEQGFSFCYTSVEMDPQATLREKEDNEENLADSLKEEKSALNHLFNYESLEQLSYLQDQYQQMKIGLAGPSATAPDKSLDVVQGELVEDLVVLMQSFREKVASISRQGQQKTETTTPHEEEEKVETTGSKRQALKQQAYSQMAIPSRRRTHKISVSDSAPSASVTTATSSSLASQDTESVDKNNAGDAELMRAKAAKTSLLPTDMPDLSQNAEVISADDSDEDYVLPGKEKGVNSRARRGRPPAISKGQEKSTSGTGETINLVNKDSVYSSVRNIGRERSEHNGQTGSVRTKSGQTGNHNSLSGDKPNHSSEHSTQTPSVMKKPQYELIMAPVGSQRTKSDTIVMNLSEAIEKKLAGAATKLTKPGQESQAFPAPSLNVLEHSMRTKKKAFTHSITPGPSMSNQTTKPITKGPVSEIVYPPPSKVVHLSTSSDSDRVDCSSLRGNSQSMNSEVIPQRRQKSVNSNVIFSCNLEAQSNPTNTPGKGFPTRQVKVIKVCPKQGELPQQALQRLKERCRKGDDDVEESLDQYLTRCEKNSQKMSSMPGTMSSTTKLFSAGKTSKNEITTTPRHEITQLQSEFQTFEQWVSQGHVPVPPSDEDEIVPFQAKSGARYTRKRKRTHLEDEDLNGDKVVRVALPTPAKRGKESAQHKADSPASGQRATSNINRTKVKQEKGRANVDYRCI